MGILATIQAAKDKFKEQAQNNKVSRYISDSKQEIKKAVEDNKNADLKNKRAEINRLKVEVQYNKLKAKADSTKPKTGLQKFQENLSKISGGNPTAPPRPKKNARVLNDNIFGGAPPFG